MENGERRTSRKVGDMERVREHKHAGMHPEVVTTPPEAGPAFINSGGAGGVGLEES